MKTDSFVLLKHPTKMQYKNTIADMLSRMDYRSKNYCIYQIMVTTTGLEDGGLLHSRPELIPMRRRLKE
jgi:hypothetical protein